VKKTVHTFLNRQTDKTPSDAVVADELKRRRDFMADRRPDDVTMTSQQVLLPGDMSNMTSLCADDDDVSVCLLMVGSRSVYLLTELLTVFELLEFKVMNFFGQMLIIIPVINILIDSL